MQDKVESKSENFPDVEKNNWEAEEISKEGANKSSDEVIREMLRGDETQGNPDDRDLVGGVKSADTPHGREETKN